MNHVTAYATEVLSGRTPACKYVRWACARHISDLDRDDIYFDERHVNLVFSFIALCRHYKGEFAGRPLELAPAQQFIVGSIFGWKFKDTGKRRFRTVYVEIPRKNGKSTLCSAIALTLLIFDKESGAEIYSAATKEDQAKIVWGDARQMVKKSPALTKITRCLHNSILFPRSASSFRPLGSDSKTQDGLNPHGVIADEVHAWPSRDLWDVLEDAFGARSQPLMIAITTAGADRNGICYEQRAHVVNFLDPNSQIDDDSYFGYVATVDDEDRERNGYWRDPEIWRKANPMLGYSKSIEYMELMAEKAKNMPGKLNTFLNKQLDIWTDGHSLMWDIERWDKCGAEVALETLKGHVCYAGIDLSSSRDITALVYVFPPGPYDEWAIFARFYVPEEKLREAQARDKVPYERWVDEDLICATPGDYIDLEFIKHDFLEYSKLFEVRECGYDPWKATELATYLENEGEKMVLIRQGHASLTPGVQALEKKIQRIEIRHGGNPVMRWMISNCTGRADPNGNLIPDKQRSYARIDGVSALVNALCRAIVAGADEKSAYEERGVLFI